MESLKNQAFMELKLTLQPQKLASLDALNSTGSIGDDHFDGPGVTKHENTQGL